LLETSSDDAMMSFTESPDRKSLKYIRLRLEAGQSATLHRSAEAMVVADDNRDRKIYITLPDDDT
jgi:hypothetical protein